MRGILLRVGIDQAYGGWNAPVDPETKEFVYVSIPEERAMAPRLATPYAHVRAELATFAKNREVDEKASVLPAPLAKRNMHFDPDFRYLTYGDNANTRGSIISKLVPGDVIAFYAGLRPCRPGGKHARKLIYALIGFYRVAEVVRVSDVEERRRIENAHTRRLRPKLDDVIVRATPGHSGRLRRCIPIGDFRDGAYRVFPPLLRAWGALSCRDGFIQRSGVPPRFLDPERFVAWFDAQKPELVQANN